MRFASVLALVLLLNLAGGCSLIPPPPNGPPQIPGVVVVNMIPASLSGEINQDSEPFLAVHPTNPQLMAASAFTPNPAGAASTTAPIFVSQDGGLSWTLNNVIPSASTTGDITHAFDSTSGGLFAGILRRPGALLLDQLMTTQFTMPTLMTVQTSRADVDQPFIAVRTVAARHRIYVGNNDFAVADGRTATVSVSLDGGSNWRQVRVEARPTSGQNGPSIRPTIAKDGTVYAAFFGWRSFSGSVATSDVVVVRDDTGATGPNPFQSLLDSDGLPGRRVAQNVTIPWSNASTLGQERIGSTLSLAVDPNNSAVVYIAWGDRVGTGDIYTIHVRRSTDRGATWTGDLRTITNATCASLAVAGDGTVGLLYQQVTGTMFSSRWETRLEQTRDAFTTVRYAILAKTPANTPEPLFLPYIGDYNFLLALDTEFRGIFSANNTPDQANFPEGVTYQRQKDFAAKRLLDGSGNAVPISIDPFYFKVPVVP
jgi:hypothetical protein